MKGFAGVTYNDWVAFLFQQSGIDEVNFWQPVERSRNGHLRPVPFLKKERQ